MLLPYTRIFHCQEDKEFHLQKYVIARLRADYMLLSHDFSILRHAAKFWNGLDDRASVLLAFQLAVKDGDSHPDPFELIIDAGFCNKYLQLIL